MAGRREAMAAFLLICTLGTSCGVEGSPRPPRAAPTTATVTAAPRWEEVTALRGSDSTTSKPFLIKGAAIQWRARWRCDSGSLKVTTAPPPRRPAPLIDVACPGNGTGYSIVTGQVRARVQASAPWTLVIDQQVDSPLVQEPLVGMTVQAQRAQGAFYPIDMSGHGRARLYALPGGRLAVRLEDFEVSQNQDLFLWASEARNPRTGVQALAAPHVVVGALKATAGDQNYLLPEGLTLARVRSLIVWCAPARIAYVGAALAR